MDFLEITKSFTPIDSYRSRFIPMGFEIRCSSTSFKQYGPGEVIEGKKYEYGRTGNPTGDTLEICLAEIEEPKYAVTYASCVLTALIGTLKKDNHVIIGQHLNSGMYNVWTEIATRFGIKITNDCSLLLRSLKTLPIRMKQHYSYKIFEKTSKNYKSTKSCTTNHPQHDLFKRQTSGITVCLDFI